MTCTVGATAALSASAAADFHIVDANAGVYRADGGSATEAGGHPYLASTHFVLSSLNFFAPDGSVKDISVDLPAGFVANPNATPTVCTPEQLTIRNQVHDCPISSQVGVAHIYWPGFGVDQSFMATGPTDFPIFNVLPRRGAPATLSFVANGIVANIVPRLRTGDDYGISADTSNVGQFVPLVGADVELWGVPADASHDAQRYCRGQNILEEAVAYGCSSDAEPTAFLTNPADCAAGPLATKLSFASWQDPTSFVSRTLVADRNGTPAAVEGCGEVPFAPAIQALPTSQAADSPTALDVDLTVPTNGLTNARALTQAALKKARVTLPAGMSVNPSSADGLGGCSATQIALTTAAPADCPDSAKIGTVEVETPLLDKTIEGSVYLATEDSFERSLLALYIAVDDPETGIVLKLPGRVDTNPVTGQLTATFDDNPQVPFSSLRLDFKTGSRAPLLTPPACGSYDIVSEFSSWSAADPDNPTPAEIVTKTSTFNVTSGPNGTPCPTRGQFDPAFEAGTVSQIAGAYSPLVVNAARPDGSQSLQGLSLTLPEGLTGKLAGVRACSDAALSAAGTKSGTAELASASCPAASKVGTVDVAAGAGSTPFHVTGTAYLAGPYMGAPLSLAVITPAVAGPFDLGTVVVRAAAQIDPVTTQVRVTSDPIPSILEGIPLKVRSVSLNTDRPQFTLNPTNCDPMSLAGTLFGTSVSRAVSNRFQVGACKALDFAPKLALSLKGPTHRRAHPALKAVLTARPGEANIARAQVKLPKAAFIDNAHIGTPCTRPAFASQTCPEASRVGRVSATTPILDYTLKGSVYLRANPAHKLPDLVADLRGPDSQPIEIELAGKTDAVKGALRNTFEAVPDAPVKKFTLELFGGKKGLIELSSGLCAHPRASVKLDAQSGAAFDTRPKVKADCSKK